MVKGWKAIIRVKQSQVRGQLTWLLGGESTQIIGQKERLPWVEILITQLNEGMCGQLLSHGWLCATPWTVARQAPLSMEFSRQEHWSRWPSSSPGDLPDPGIKPRSSSLQANSLPSETPGKPILSEVRKRKANRIWYHLYVGSKVWPRWLIYETETGSQTWKDLWLPR